MASTFKFSGTFLFCSLSIVLLNLNCTIYKYCETVKKVSKYPEENIQKSGQFPYTVAILKKKSN